MTFVNETIHPEAGNLMAAILKGGRDNITPLLSWREGMGLSDKQAVILYDLVAKEFNDQSPDSVLTAVAVSKASRALWRAGI